MTQPWHTTTRLDDDKSENLKHFLGEKWRGSQQRDWQLPRPTFAQAQESSAQFPETLN